MNNCLKASLLFLGGILVVAFGEAAPIADSIVDHLQTLKRSAGEIEYFWLGEDGDQPPGGYLYRFDADLSGHGDVVTFIGSSLDESKGKGTLWSLYRREVSGGYRKIAVGVFLDPFSQYLKLEGSVRKLVDFQGDRLGGHVTVNMSSMHLDHSTYKLIIEGRDLTEDETEAVSGNESALRQIFGLEEKHKPAVEKILLAKYMQNHSAAWSPFKFGLGLSGQHADPADAEDIKTYKDFLPPVAFIANPNAKVTSVLHGVKNNGDATYTAYYGYDNPGAQTDVEIGPKNKFAQGPENRGQPTHFLAGRSPDYPNSAFSVVFDGSTITWTLNGHAEPANKNSHSPEVAQLPPAVANKAVTSIE